jgi:inhibitor of KinA sporulation pathway (predicted exonuclease)
MATDINETKTITLIDNTEISLRPLKISLLREFNKKFEEISKVADDNDKSTTVLLECVQIALQQYKPELAGDRKALEDNIDLPTVYKIIEAASGVNLAEVANIMG